LEYLGSTYEPTLAKRLTKHVGQYRSYVKGTFNYVSSFEILENNDYDIILIEKYPCNDRDELYSRECYFTNQIDCVNIYKNQGLFKRLGGKKEYKKEYMKEYQELNKDKLIEYNKEYRESNKDNIARNKKEYYNNNKHKIQGKKKDYYNSNKKIINEKHKCECGGKYTYGNKSQHFKSNKHIKYTEQQNEKV
jgi:hypothetical protein